MTYMPTSFPWKSTAARALLLFTVALLIQAAAPAATPATAEGELAVSTKQLTLDDRDPGKKITIDPTGIANFDPAKLKRPLTSKQKLVTATFDAATNTITVVPVDRGLTVEDAQDTLEIVYDETSPQNLKAEVKLTIKKRVKEGPVVVIKGDTPLTDKIISDNKLTLLQGQSVPVKLRYKLASDTEYTYSDNLTLTPAPPDVLNISTGPPVTLKAAGPSDKEVKVTTHITGTEAEPERSALNFTIQVGEPIEGIEIKEGTQTSITEGETHTLDITALGPGNTRYPAAKVSSITAASAVPAAVNVKTEGDGRITLEARDIGAANNRPVRISFAAKQPNGTLTPLTQFIDVTLIGKNGSIEFRPEPRDFLLPNDSITTTVVARSREGQEVVETGVDFKLVNEGDAKWVTLAPAGRTLTVYWNDPADVDQSLRPSQVLVEVTAFPKGLQAIKRVIPIRLRVVKGFAPLTVRLDVMNERMARDLYGKQMSDDFHVLVVRLFNNLKDDRTGQFIGNSILAYSSSIEVAVGMEKKYRDNKDSHFDKVLDSQEASSDDQQVAQQAQTERNTAITKDQERLTELLTARNDADAEVQKARVALVKAHDKAIKAKVEYQKNKNEVTKKTANDAVTEYNADVAAWQGAKDNRRLVGSQIADLQKSILDNASAVYNVGRTYREYGDPNTAVDDGKWRPISRSDLEHIASQDASENTSFLDEEAPQPMTEVTDDSANLVAPPPNTLSPGRITNDGLPNKPQCLGTATYRPFTFEMMVNTVDRRDGRSFRTKLFTTLDALGTAASLVTAIAVPGPSSDFPLGLDKYRNLLIPNAERLFPNFKEPQRQNIVSQAMKIIEEIPFGSDITRVIFIPRKQIDGVLRGHDVRISEVCTFFFKVDVAIIQKAGTVQAGGAPR
jgi:hypothetical protein